MGKRNRNNKKKNRKKNRNYQPFVSICTPTFNRRPFIPYMIKCFEHQDYPREKLEWIIIDDGTDCIEDLVKDIPEVKYFRFEEKMTLGKKRNLMHEKSTGEIIVYMDDDDYYPPNRVSHAVKKLVSNKALIGGSSEIYIWFKHTQQMVQFGPYGPTHATAGTFAFKRKLLDITSYEETASLAEEKHFLKGYTIPFVQFDPLKTLLVFSHEHNTFDKRTLLEGGWNKFMKESDKTVDMFIKEPELKEFYMEKITEVLKEYELGESKYKPDVLKQTAEIKEKRKQQMEQAQQQAQQQAKKNGKIIIEDDKGNKKELNSNEIVTILQQQQKQLKQNSELMTIMQQKIQEQENVITTLKEELKSFVNPIDINVIENLDISNTTDISYVLS